MPKKYAVCVAPRDVVDPREMVEVIEARGWQLTGRMHYLEPDEEGLTAAILGNKIPKKLWTELPEVMQEGRSISFLISKSGFEIQLTYICDGDVLAIAANWKSLAAPESVYSDLFLPLASGFGAWVAALIHSEGDWASDGFRSDHGGLEVRRSLISWAENEHQLHVRESARDRVRGVSLGNSAGEGWLQAKLEA